MNFDDLWIGAPRSSQPPPAVFLGFCYKPLTESLGDLFSEYLSRVLMLRFGGREARVLLLCHASGHAPLQVHSCCEGRYDAGG